MRGEAHAEPHGNERQRGKELNGVCVCMYTLSVLSASSELIMEKRYGSGGIGELLGRPGFTAVSTHMYHGRAV